MEGDRMNVLTIHDDGTIEEFEIPDELFESYEPTTVRVGTPEGFGHAASVAALLG